MRQGEDTNYVVLNGTAVDAPQLSHNAGGRPIYTMRLSAERLSGREDVLNLTLREELCERLAIKAGDKLTVTGAMRSCNHLEDGRSRLLLSVFAREAEPGGDDKQNSILLTGTICKPPSYRVTPLGRELCDVMLAARRKYGKFDFLPIIFWGRNAKLTGTFTAGTRISCEGRVQSREYIKKTEDGETVKTAYEVSAGFVEVIE